MLVSPIKTYNNSNANFAGRKPTNRDLQRVITNKQKLFSFLDTTKAAAATTTAAATTAAITGALFLTSAQRDKNPEKMPKEIEKTGIKYCEFKDGQVIIMTNKNDAFYKITPQKLSVNTTLEEILLNELNDDKTSVISGFKNYKDCIDNLGRQDIVKKGLGVHTYKLDNNFSIDKKFLAARLITRYSKIGVSPQNLFFIEDNAFFYDKTNNTVYSVNPKNDTSAVYSCEFITDNNGHAIGYDREIWSVYYDSRVQDKYIEQTEPSKTIPDCVNYNDNKGFAEACRFGNSKPSSRTKDGIPAVLSKLIRLGFENVEEQDLQFVKYNYDKYDGDKSHYLINYYNPLSGKSLTFNEEGKYLYQTEYVKDDNGQIIFCTHERY